MKHWYCWLLAVLLCLAMVCCKPLLEQQMAVSAIDAAIITVDALEQGKTKIRLYAPDIDQDALFRAVESIWPYACTMQLTIYHNGMVEIALGVEDSARQQQALTLAKGMAAQAVDGLTEDTDKLLALHDLLVRSCVYDLPTAEAVSAVDGASVPFTAYGALVNGKAVCAGYSRAFVLLCQAAGLDAIYIADTEMNHGWNAVRLEGVTYFIDCTFDDPVPDQGEYVSHEYFLRPTAAFETTHTWDKEFYEQVMDAKWGKT